MLCLQRHDRGAQFDAGGAGTPQADSQQCIEVVGHLRDPCGVHARVLSPLDIGEHSRNLARGIATLGADHYSETHVCLPGRWNCLPECSYLSDDNVLAKKENANIVDVTRSNAEATVSRGREPRRAGWPASRPMRQPSPATPRRSQ